VADGGRRAGTLRVGTSGFAYPGWSPRFYPPGLRGDELLRYYASKLSACELNNTFYQQPKEPAIARWLAAVGDDFRFAVKALRSGSARALQADPASIFEWLTGPYRWFGERLGGVLYRIPEQVERDDERLARLLDAWPSDLPLVMEFQHPSWHMDEVFDQLARHRAVLCATELDASEGPPSLHLTGDFLYLRLRRSTYTDEELAGWAERLRPFLEAGHDAFVFFRHDEDGQTPAYALGLEARVLGTSVAR
jgi:uncharacterized protein YecE (DUF72 family)